MWGNFRKQFRYGGQSKTEKIIMGICKGNTMKKDMLNSQIYDVDTRPEQRNAASGITSHVESSVYLLGPLQACL